MCVCVRVRCMVTARGMGRVTVRMGLRDCEGGLGYWLAMYVTYIIIMCIRDCIFGVASTTIMIDCVRLSSFRMTTTFYSDKI